MRLPYLLPPAVLALAAAGLTACASTARGQTPPPATATSPHMSFPEPTETIDLWPSRPPGAPARLPVETVRERSSDPAYNDRYVTGVSRPRMAVFRPRRPNGSAVLITPGGGYERVVIDKEGYEMARWLAERGVTDRAGFEVVERQPFGGPLMVSFGDRVHALGDALAEAMRVELA